MHDNQSSTMDGERSLRLKDFLRQHRLDIPPQTPLLGTHERQPMRLGKRVTQEELAEAIGISRVWYCVLERGGRVSVSPRLVDRLARALMLSNEKREALFYLAVPGLAGEHIA